MNKKQRGFVIAGVVAFSTVVVIGGAFGLSSALTPSQAGSELPSTINTEDIGDGGVETSTVKLVADTKNFQVWTATDRKGNLCTISLAIPEGNSGSVCTPKEEFEIHGSSSSVQVGTAEQGDLNTTYIQAYRLPPSVNVKAARASVLDSEVYGDVLVRYGQVDQRGTATVELPTRSGDSVELQLLGAN